MQSNKKFYGFKNLMTFIIAARVFGGAHQNIPEPIGFFQGFSLAKTFFAAAKSADKSLRTGIKHCEQELGVRIDPLYLPWDRHRQLSSLNENAYSDWLAWTLEVAQSEKVSLGELITTLFPPNCEILKKIPQGPARILREMPVEHGHEGQSGRTDLLLVFEKDSFVWHVEVKVTSAESADLAKNPGYAEALKALYPGKTICNFILATATKQETYHGFRAVTWIQLCQRLRSWVARREYFHLAECQSLIFCGLVEHQLLKICPGSFSHLKYLEDRME